MTATPTPAETELMDLLIFTPLQAEKVKYNGIMNEAADWRESFRAELALAKAARAKGNEGRARVCARRAAGIVVSEYLQRHNLGDRAANAYTRLKLLANLERAPEKIRQVAAHFLLRVDADFSFPAEVDLISDAEWLARTLLEGPQSMSNS